MLWYNPYMYTIQFIELFTNSLVTAEDRKTNRDRQKMKEREKQIYRAKELDK